MPLSLPKFVIESFAAPFVGSYAAEALGWLWKNWVYVIATVALMLTSFIVFEEAYNVKILERRFNHLRRQARDSLLIKYSHNSRRRAFHDLYIQCLIERTS